MCRCFLLWWCCKEEENDGNVLLFSSMVLLQRRRRWHLVAIAFFSDGVETKTTMVTSCHCFVFCVREEKDDNNVLSFFLWFVVAKKAMFLFVSE